MRHGIQDLSPKLCILLRERRHEGIKESENVVADQHLAVAMRSRPYADCGNAQPGSHSLGNRIRNRLKDYGERSGVFERECIESQFLRSLSLQACCLIPPRRCTC